MDKIFTRTQELTSKYLSALTQSERSDTCLSTHPFIPQQCFSLPILKNSLDQKIAKLRDHVRTPPAVFAQYGNKFGNLQQMDAIDQALDLQGLEIPAPRGVDSETITRFLNQKNTKFLADWKQLGKLYQQHRGDDPFLETEEATKLLKKIAVDIEQAFSSDATPEFFKPLLPYLAERKKAHDFLMVRSTGAEDSKKLANAGGNESPPYVDPTPKEVLKAMGRVVKSYFGKRSLQNRLNGGTNPFEEPLKLPVLIQQLIGEEIGGAKYAHQIPISFVLFTQEPLYVGQEKFRVMRISATPGHGEGVVGGCGIATDTILLLQSEKHPDRLYKIYDNQFKPERLAPVQKGNTVVLQKVKNPNTLATRPALTDTMLAQLFRSGTVMESFYAGSTDIEGVFKNGQAYFVQARPINRKPLLPTFLKGTEGIVSQEKADILVPGAGKVLAIRAKEKVLVAPTLAEAERIFHAAARNTYDLIVVQQAEPQNSHPVVNFSSLGIPCLYSPNPAALQELLNHLDAHHVLAICMQKGTLSLWDTRKGSLEQAIEEGFVVHPAKIALSLDVSSQPAYSLPKTPEEIKHIVDDLYAASSPTDRKKALQRISHEIDHFQSILVRLEGTIAAMTHASMQAKSKINMLKKLHQQLRITLDEVGAVIQKNPQDLEKLFHYKVLHTLLTDRKNGLGQYSLVDAHHEITLIEELIAHQQTLPQPARYEKMLLLGLENALPQVRPLWKDFVQKMELYAQYENIAPEELHQFEEFFSILAETGSLAEWMTFHLPVLPSPLPPPSVWQSFLTRLGSTAYAAQKESLMQSLRSRLPPKADFPFLQNLREKQKQIQHIQHNLARFSDDSSYPAAWAELSVLLTHLTQTGKNLLIAPIF